MGLDRRGVSDGRPWVSYSSFLSLFSEQGVRIIISALDLFTVRSAVKYMGVSTTDHDFPNGTIKTIQFVQTNGVGIQCSCQ